MSRGRWLKVLALLAVLLAAGALLFRPWRRPALDPPAVVRQIQALQELATVRYRIEKVVGLEEQKYPVGAEKLLIVVQADVRAGIDLAGVRAEQVRIDGADTLRVHLPDPRILSVAIDEKATKVWDRRITWWTPWVPFSPDLEQKARLAALGSVEQAAREMGILRQARDNAERSLRSLFQSMGFRQVTFGPVS
ncbi:MAG: DUF4230 domain-containing protein [Bryobacteraceae bacterium]|nr:DUF4230 domain-containing protein [Bryobacteraceae bacterium]